MDPQIAVDLMTTGSSDRIVKMADDRG